MTLLENKKAKMRYTVLETYEAGIELLGTEVKSLRAKLGKLDGSYVIVRGGEAYMVNVSIPPFQKTNADEHYNDQRPRKLLLSKKQLGELLEYEDKKGLTIVPFMVYNKGRYIKVRVCVVKGKNARDKRQDIKKRDDLRDIQRTLKNR